jgi:pimeloyl-ACP methyl ester carboxylesterase
VTAVLDRLALDRHTWTWRDRQIQYAVCGEGQPLFLIHGFGASIGHWRNNIPDWAKAGYRVYAIDLLGFGDSEKALVDYSLELWRDLIADFWGEFINTPTVWIGNSIGALLALMLAADHPEKTRGAVLLNCAGGLNHRPDELNPVLGFILGSFAKVVSAPIIGNALFEVVRRPSQIRRTLHQVYRNTAAIDAELVELLYRPSCDPNAQKVFASILTAPAGPKPEELLPRVTCPLLVLWGEDDPWTPIDGADLYKTWKGNTTIDFFAIPNAGHCPHDDRPEVVNHRVLDWLAHLVIWDNHAHADRDLEALTP